MKTILLKYKKEYICNMFIGKDLLVDINKYLTPILPGKKAVIITNPLVRELYGNKIADLFSENGILTHIIEIPDGEKSKSLLMAGNIYDHLLQFKTDRSTSLVALGGGVIGDLAGFVAATFMRGIPLIHIPTTLLAQIDSSIGGKTAIDHPKAKNIIGSFYQPIACIADTDVLASLPIAHLKNGIVEAIKIAIISSPSFFSWIDDNIEQLLFKDKNALENLVNQAARLKVNIILEDPWENHRRYFLNLGHSIGHALEVTGGYDWITHGEAVALGTILETRIATYKRLCEPEENQRIENIFRKLKILENIDLTKIKPLECWNAILLDKKNKNGNIRFVLPEKVGKVKLQQSIVKKDVDYAFDSLQNTGGSKK
ncbi:MAG: 3-dehydroquinate synthase [Atribacterota bacterium]|nr:3-dehydroquinate synthase [Atribacterota bacterium]